MVRPSGLRGAGSTKRGQADPFDEPRARVSSWPPLRPARLRRERGSVVIVSPTAPTAMDGGQADEARNRDGHPPHPRGGGGPGGRPAAAARPGRHTCSGLEGFGRTLSKDDEVVVEATGNAMAVV